MLYSLIYFARSCLINLIRLFLNGCRASYVHKTLQECLYFNPPIFALVEEAAVKMTGSVPSIIILIMNVSFLMHL